MPPSSLAPDRSATAMSESTVWSRVIYPLLMLAEVRDVKAWSKRVSFWAPRAFAKLEVELLRPVYLPAYLVSGVLVAVQVTLR